MALQLELLNSKGAITRYHRILAVSQIYTGEQIGVNINLASYSDELYREKEKETGEEMIVNNTGLFLPLVDENFSRANLYARIRSEIIEFTEAIDC